MDWFNQAHTSLKYTSWFLQTLSKCNPLRLTYDFISNHKQLSELSHKCSDGLLNLSQRRKTHESRKPHKSVLRQKNRKQSVHSALVV